MTAEAGAPAEALVRPPVAANGLMSVADDRADAILRSLSRRFRTPRDGEQRKTLAKIYQAIQAAQELETRGALGEPQRSTIVRLLETDATTLGLDALLALMDIWDRTLIQTCDEMYVRGLLRVEINRSHKDQPTSVVTLEDAIPGAAATWTTTLAMCEGLTQKDWDCAANQLYELYRQRVASYQLQRARERLSTELLTLAGLIVIALVAILLVALYRVNPIAIAASAGALGGCLSSTMQLRALPRQLGALRAFQPLAFLQPLVGAAAGLFVYMLLSAGATGVFNTQVFGSGNAWAVTGLVAFVVGFSEPRFIRTVSRLADLVLEDEKPDAPRPDANAETAKEPAKT